MTRTEYRVIAVDSTEALEESLNELTAEGWSKDHYTQTATQFVVIFKRSRATQGNK